MSYTLKIRWTSYDAAGILVDEATLFIPADEITVHGELVAIPGDDPMQGWQDGSFLEYRSVVIDDVDVALSSSVPCSVSATRERRNDGRLIKVVRDGVETWYTASHAWILGPTGSTIERIAP